MEQKNNKMESYTYKVNKSYMVVANTVSEAEQIFKKHYPTIEVTDLKKCGKVLM